MFLPPGWTPQQFMRLLNRIRAELPDESVHLLARLRRQQRAPVLKVVMQTVLSHQTTSRQTRRAIDRLWTRYHTLRRLAEARPAEIKRLIDNLRLGLIKDRCLGLDEIAFLDWWGSGW